MEDGIAREGLEKAEEIVDRYEGWTRKLTGVPGWIVTGVAVGTSLFYLYAATATIVTQMLRGLFVMLTLFLTILAFPGGRKNRQRIPWYDWVLAFLACLPILYMLWDFEEFVYRAVTPTSLDLVMGVILIALILEATRRTTGWILAVIILGFLVYAYAGEYLPAPWNHRGYDLERIVGHMYMALEGIFGVPIDVAATFIILFTIYGAFLDKSGAGQFFIDFSFAAMGGKPTGAGRTAVLASFLLGGPAGSGVATTVTIGSVAWPMLRKAGYDRDSAGGFLSAGGLGAVLSPPVMGAAAFLICEILKISYLEVIAMACMPTILYYWSIFLMVEFDAKKFGVQAVVVESKGSLKDLTFRYGYHFVSLITIILFMLLGFTAILAVFWSVVIVFLLSFIRPESALGPAKLIAALRKGTVDVLSVAATCAGAGIIVGVVTLTGLGLQFSSIVIDLAGGDPLHHHCVHGFCPLGDRAGRAGYGDLHHRRGDHRPGHDQAGRAGVRGSHVCFLLRGPGRSDAPDRPLGLRRRGDYRGRPLPDDDDVLEIYPAGFPGSLHVHGSSGRSRASSERPPGQHHHHQPDRPDRRGSAGRGHERLAHSPDYLV